MAQQAKTFEEKVLHVIEQTDNGKGTGGSILKVLSWVVDGKIMRPSIEKYDWWNTEDGGKRNGKRRGLSSFDLLAILRDLPNIAKAMQIAAADIQLALNDEKRTPVTAGPKQAF